MPYLGCLECLREGIDIEEEEEDLSCLRALLGPPRSLVRQDGRMVTTSWGARGGGCGGGARGIGDGYFSSGSDNASRPASALVVMVADGSNDDDGDHLQATQVPWPMPAAAHIITTRAIAITTNGTPTIAVISPANETS